MRIEREETKAPQLGGATATPKRQSPAHATLKNGESAKMDPQDTRWGKAQQTGWKRGNSAEKRGYSNGKARVSAYTIVKRTRKPRAATEKKSSQPDDRGTNYEGAKASTAGKVEGLTMCHNKDREKRTEKRRLFLYGKPLKKNDALVKHPSRKQSSGWGKISHPG